MLPAFRDPRKVIASYQLGQFGGHFVNLRLLLERSGMNLDRLPYCIRVLIEQSYRHYAIYSPGFDESQFESLLGWQAVGQRTEVSFLPGRVLLQDYTGAPAVVDLAAMRGRLKAAGLDPKRVNPQIPVDLVVDHSISPWFSGGPLALADNMSREFELNRARFGVFAWGRNAFDDFRVVPSGNGIVHQVNCEHLAKVLWRHRSNGFLFPDTVFGADSHTTMVGGLGVLGYGVGGIEAEAAMLGEASTLLIPDVIGLKLSGKLKPGVTITDLALHVTEALRRVGVVEKFVELFGPAISTLSVPDRMVIANMAPEQGSTISWTPPDENVLSYLKFTGRGELVDPVRDVLGTMGVFRNPDSPDPEYTKIVELNLSEIEPCVAGPSRPQDRVLLSAVPEVFACALKQPAKKGGFGVKTPDAPKAERTNGELAHGSVVIAAITSCTNTSNPGGMLSAGLLAKKAVARGLRTKPHVKTTLSPGSRVVTDYLLAAGLTEALETLGFYTVGYGCMTCIGNAGNLLPGVSDAINAGDLAVSAVLSGNRNFTGRVHKDVKAAWLASPALVIAYGILGNTTEDITSTPLGVDSNGQPVYLHEIWPTPEEIEQALACISPEMFLKARDRLYEGPAGWSELVSGTDDTFDWDPASTYAVEPPFVSDDFVRPYEPIRNARVLGMFGDDVTTDHISPAGSIASTSPAGVYLQSLGVAPADLNSYGARRANHRVMERGTFDNPRLLNTLLPDRQGNFTLHHPSGEIGSFHHVAGLYAAASTPLILIGGKNYGSGSSRDWAAKGPLLLGVRAVIAQSFERIHRSNLVMAGILPLQFLDGESATTHGISGNEFFDIELDAEFSPQQSVTVWMVSSTGEKLRNFGAICRVDSARERELLLAGGILPATTKRLLAEA